MEMIEVRGLKKSYGSLEVLRGVSFTLKKGDTVAIIGPSGSGKSTLLRCVIELERADGGDIIVENNAICRDGVYSHDKALKDIRLKMGMVFQHFNLFPHMSVRENLICAPRFLKKAGRDELNHLCEDMLNKVGLLEKINERPANLSGGQKQRVAIARALMLKPDIMLFDEPTSALDPELTKEVLSVIQELGKEHMSMIIVTHEIAFARDAASKVIFMDNGVVVDSGSPDEIIDNPKNERIQLFLNKII